MLESLPVLSVEENLTAFSRDRGMWVLLGTQLFLGSALVSYYSQRHILLWVLVTTLAFMYWLECRRQLRLSSRSSLVWLAVKAMVATLLARVLGGVFLWLVFDRISLNSLSPYDLVDGSVLEVVRIVLNGGISQTIYLILCVGAIALGIAYGTAVVSSALERKVIANPEDRHEDVLPDLAFLVATIAGIILLLGLATGPSAKDRIGKFLTLPIVDSIQGAGPTDADPTFGDIDDFTRLRPDLDIKPEF